MAVTESHEHIPPRGRSSNIHDGHFGTCQIHHPHRDGSFSAGPADLFNFFFENGFPVKTWNLLLKQQGLGAPLRGQMG